ncbi:MAG: hypothetical protein LIO58_09695, partial [Oscillospiraceae bacterium]|nr:hypothetical protein [Oscillospiraceae bacterium]
HAKQRALLHAVHSSRKSAILQVTDYILLYKNGFCANRVRYIDQRQAAYCRQLSQFTCAAARNFASDQLHS